MGKVLKAHIAKRKVKKCIKNDEYDVDLREYSEMEDEAALVLAECEKALDLRDLEVLTDKAAEYLATHNKSITLAKVYDLSETAAKFLAEKRSFIHFEMPTITENFAKIFADGTARLKMTHLKSLNGSDEHLAFAKYLRDTRMIIHCFALSDIDDRILTEIPDFKKK
jgi:hypothetical protein